MEQSQDLRLPGVPDPTEGGEKNGEADADVFAVRGRDVLLRRARRSALAGAHALLPRSSPLDEQVIIIMQHMRMI